MAGMSAGERARRGYNRRLVGRWKMLKGCSHCDFQASHGFQLELDHIVWGVTKKYKGTDRAFEAHWSKDRIKKELSKCQVLCKNCHALKTYRERYGDEKL